jgi:hypothetical protein
MPARPPSATQVGYERSAAQGRDGHQTRGCYNSLHERGSTDPTKLSSDCGGANSDFALQQGSSQASFPIVLSIIICQPRPILPKQPAKLHR